MKQFFRKRRGYRNNKAVRLDITSPFTKRQKRGKTQNQCVIYQFIYIQTPLNSLSSLQDINFDSTRSAKYSSEVCVLYLIQLLEPLKLDMGFPNMLLFFLLKAKSLFSQCAEYASSTAVKADEKP